MLAVIAVGPAVEASVAHRRQIIRNQVGPDLIAFVGDGPELAGLRLPLQAGRIAHAAGEDAMRARRNVDLPDRGPLIFGSDSVFAYVAVGSDSDIELGAIRTGQQRLGPVMIDRSAGKIRELGARRGDAGLSILIWIADDGIGVRNVEIVTNQGDAEWRVEMIQKHGSYFGNAVTISVAQQRDAVCVLCLGTGK